jgi:hypothetical protein
MMLITKKCEGNSQSIVYPQYLPGVHKIVVLLLIVVQPNF